jgi:hypothetical protein
VQTPFDPEASTDIDPTTRLVLLFRQTACAFDGQSGPAAFSTGDIDNELLAVIRSNWVSRRSNAMWNLFRKILRRVALPECCSCQPLLTTKPLAAFAQAIATKSPGK